VKTVKVQYGSADSAGSDRRFLWFSHGERVGDVELALHQLVHVSDWGGRYRLGHRPVGFDEQPFGGGTEPGSMYSQAYISVIGVGGRSASIAPCDRVYLKRRALEAGRG